jgi:hypothetical protein
LLQCQQSYLSRTVSYFHTYQARRRSIKALK